MKTLPKLITGKVSLYTVKAYQNFTSAGGWTSETRSSDLRLVSSASMAGPRHLSDVEEGHTVPVSTTWTMVDGALYWPEIHQDFHDGLTSAALVRR